MNLVIQEIKTDCCKFCESVEVIKKGKKKTKHGDFQQFQCKTCNKRFIQNLGFERMRATPEAITASLNLYFNGESLRHVADSMKLFGVKVTHQTIFLDTQSGQRITPLRLHNSYIVLEYSGISFLMDGSQDNS